MITRKSRSSLTLTLFLTLILLTCLVYGSANAYASQSNRDSFSVYATPFGPGSFDDTDPRFVYNGDWEEQSSVPDVYLNTLHVSYTVGNTIQFLFIGNELRVFFQAGPGQGTMRLTLDTASYVMNEASSSRHSFEWVLGASNSGTHTVTIRHDGGGEINFDAIIVPVVPATPTPTPPAFVDVPVSHQYYKDIETLYANGLTSGCQLSPPKFCPDKNMNRAEAAAFMMRAHFGPSYVPPAATHIFVDDWTKGLWAEPWAEAMKKNEFSAGCQVNPPKYCPWELIPREQAVVFALKIKYGKDYTPPPATGTLFADMTDTSFYATAWAEQAYTEGLITNCGMSGGKPKICPKTLVSRGLAAYMIVRAKDLSMP